MFTNLETLCRSTTKQVFDLLSTKGFHYNGQYAFRPGAKKSSPLVVCHADTVVDGGDGPHSFSQDGHKVVSIALDDRLGIACMVDAIDRQTLLSNCAMLVCDDEEIGRSTAKQFKEDICPNWMVELDRRGTDVVCYEYESTLFSSILESVGWTVGQGSFSDICYLGALGVCGFNMGVAYHNEHSKDCHADLRQTKSQLSKLDRFLSTFATVRLAYDGQRSNSRFGLSDDYYQGYDDGWADASSNDKYDDWNDREERFDSWKY